jgi:hypothetical protein
MSEFQYLYLNENFVEKKPPNACTVPFGQAERNGFRRKSPERLAELQTRSRQLPISARRVFSAT